jgi:hypothetical protein
MSLARTVIKVAIAATLLASSAAYADWSGSVHVKSIATDVYPYQGVAIQVDNGPCPQWTGSWNYYRFGAPADDNLKATYAAVLAAYLSNRTVWIYVTNDCTLYAIRPN